MSLLAIALSIASILLLGMAVTTQLPVRSCFRTRIEWLPVSFAAGSIVAANWGLAQVVTQVAIHPAWLLPPALVLLWRARPQHLTPISGQRLDWQHLIAALILGYAVLRLTAGAVASLDRDMGWDGLFIWGIKAKMLTMPELGYFSEPWLGYSHPDYPLLIPSLNALTFQWAGGLDLRAVKWLSPFSLGLTALLVYLGLRQFRGPASSAIFALAVMLPTTAVQYVPYSYADLTLAAFFTGAVVYACLYARTHAGGHLVLTGLFLSATTLSKKEGLLLTLAVISALAIALVIKRGVPHRGALKAPLAVALLSCTPWLLFGMVVHPISQDYVPITLGSIANAARRAPEIIIRLKGELVGFDRWGATWLLLPLGMLVFPDRLRRPEVVVAIVSVLLPLALYAITFGFTTWSTPLAHMNSSIDRLLLHLSPGFLFAAGVISARGGPESGQH